MQYSLFKSLLCLSYALFYRVKEVKAELIEDFGEPPIFCSLGRPETLAQDKEEGQDHSSAGLVAGRDPIHAD